MTRRTTRGSREPVPVELRRYAPSDFRVVRRLWDAAGLRAGPSDSSREIERSRRRDPDLFLVAEIHGRIVGAVLGRFDGRRGWVNHMAVATSARSRGVGSLLMRELERRLHAKGCPKVNLHVTPANAGVRAFYRSLGYAERDMLFMEKWLRR